MVLIAFEWLGSSGQLQSNLEIRNFTGGLRFYFLGDSVKKPEKTGVSTDTFIIWRIFNFWELILPFPQSPEKTWLFTLK